MEKRLIIAITGILTFLFICQSCSENDEGEPVIIEASVDDFLLHTMHNGGEYPSVPNDNRYPKEAFMLGLEVKTDAEAWNPEGRGRVMVDLDDPIVDIRIFTMEDFNTEKPAGTDVSDLFKDYPLNITKSLHDTTEKGQPVTRLDYHDGFFYKALLTHPVAGTHRFRVEMEFRSGRTLTNATQPLEIY